MLLMGSMFQAEGTTNGKAQLRMARSRMVTFSMAILAQELIEAIL